MPYQLIFLQSAKREWDKLDSSLKTQFKKKLAECLKEPHIVKNQLTGMKDCYKIKLRTAGYRLVYRVFDDRIIVQVIAVGKRDKNFTYEQALKRLK